MLRLRLSHTTTTNHPPTNPDSLTTHSTLTTQPTPPPNSPTTHPRPTQKQGAEGNPPRLLAPCAMPMFIALCRARTFPHQVDLEREQVLVGVREVITRDVERRGASVRRGGGTGTCRPRLCECQQADGGLLLPAHKRRRHQGRLRHEIAGWDPWRACDFHCVLGNSGKITRRRGGEG